MRSRPHDNAATPASLSADGTIASDALDGTEVPIAFVAVTVNV